MTSSVNSKDIHATSHSCCTPPQRGVNGQIPGANQHIERQEVALPKQMHISVAM